MNNRRRIYACTLVCMLALSVLRAHVAAQGGEPVSDIVIRNGRVLDGAGNPSIAADVAIKDGHFVRLASRGLIKEGCWADVVIFDYDKIQDRATYAQPLLFPEGIDYVLVNGQVVIEHGRHTGARPGQVLYGPGRVNEGQ
jgi:N-acyl-D-aspartate/D-glutamate deacylase